MKREYFLNQVTRVKQHFGEKPFSAVFVEILWGNVGMVHDWAFKQAVDEVIANYQKSPRVADFMVEIGKALEVHRRKEEWRRKKEEEGAFEEFWKGKNHPEDVAYRINTIKSFLAGKLPQKEWEDFKAMMKHAADDFEAERKNIKGQCMQCVDNSGWEEVKDHGLEHSHIPTVRRCKNPIHAQP